MNHSTSKPNAFRQIIFTRTASTTHAVSVALYRTSLPIVTLRTSEALGVPPFLWYGSELQFGICGKMYWKGSLYYRRIWQINPFVTLNFSHVTDERADVWVCSAPSLCFSVLGTVNSAARRVSLTRIGYNGCWWICEHCLCNETFRICMLLIARFPVITATVINADDGPLFWSDPLSITWINRKKASTPTDLSLCSGTDHKF